LTDTPPVGPPKARHQLPRGSGRFPLSRLAPPPPKASNFPITLSTHLIPISPATSLPTGCTRSVLFKKHGPRPGSGPMEH